LGEEAPEAVLLSLADETATGPDAPALPRVLATGGELLARFWREPPAPPLLRGADVVRELGVAPGPQVGRLLALAADAETRGEVSTREEALELLRVTIQSS
jgi:poly(A) polymerase/tRNA nucleotidyltransferase (CCA-adding enzyme)